MSKTNQDKLENEVRGVLHALYVQANYPAETGYTWDETQDEVVTDLLALIAQSNVDLLERLAAKEETIVADHGSYKEHHVGYVDINHIEAELSKLRGK